MKRLLVLIISVISVLHAYAQDANSLPLQSTTAVDSLSLRLKKLQHDYDFLSCDYQLYQVKMDLNGLSQDISIKTNGVLIDVSHTRYDRDLYSAFSASYDSSCDVYDSIKRKYDSVKSLVMLKVYISDFTDEEINLIDSYFNSINASMNVIDSSLRYYDAAIQAYRKKR